MVSLRFLRKELLRYYDKHKRDLPWRRTRDPYAIWVSEIMLQQTQVDTVRPRYQTFLDRFPTVEALALSSEEEVCEAWAGLGYYRRARHLHQAARQIVNDCNGKIPGDVPSLQNLSGIGRYTAGAIASIAFSREAPLVDGNVARVLARLFAIAGPVNDRRNEQRYWAIASDLVVGPRPGELNQALMEFGSQICTPMVPHCDSCPLRSHCKASMAGKVKHYPAPKKRTARKKLPLAFAWIESKKGVLLRKRPLNGLWPGLWEMPSCEGTHAKAELKKYGRILEPLAYVRAELSHREISATVYRVTTQNKRMAPRQRWFLDPLEAPLSAVAKKAIVATQNSLRNS